MAVDKKMNNKTQLATIAVNRFGLGARMGELSDAKFDPRQWLLRQMKNPVFDASLGNRVSALELIAEIKGLRRKIRSGDKLKPEAIFDAVKGYRRRLLLDSLRYSISTETPFSLRLLDFFSNHFSVSAIGHPMMILSPILEREAIAPNLFGHFEDMLIAVEQHPAMLLYLNNVKSVGPNSPIGKRSRGLNENLAREILELHTLGVNAGYSLSDVRQLAMAISGWSISNENEAGSPGFRFRIKAHEPGSRELLGKSYPAGGLKQGEAILRDLARHEQTAQHISLKLAQHLIADKPPGALVAAMSDTWLNTRGNLKAVITTLVEHPLSWNLEPEKVKTPREFVVSACRAIDQSKMVDKRLLAFALRGLNTMGQKPFDAGSPAGYGILNSDWMGSDGLMKCIDWVNQLSNKTNQKPDAVVERIFSSKLSPVTEKLISGAESRAQGLSLLLLSPEFHRR